MLCSCVFVYAKAYFLTFKAMTFRCLVILLVFKVTLALYERIVNWLVSF